MTTLDKPRATGTSPLLEVDELAVHYRSQSRAARRMGYAVRAVDGVTFSVFEGETLGLVGESGCGKSTIGRAVLKLVKPTGGAVRFDGQDVAEAKGRTLAQVRRGSQAVFQDPYDSLNPRMSVGSLVAEPLIIHKLAQRDAVKSRVAELLELVGLSADMASRRPAELSGGQRQRVCIARALAVGPRFIVCDEAVSALDVSVQAQILNLLRRLQRELGLSYLFIGHDLSVVRHVSDRVAVMYVGQLVESADVDPIYSNPYHPYTMSLLAASPVPDPEIERDRPEIAVIGEPPGPSNVPTGCRFAPRCPFAQDRCREQAPDYVEVEPARWVACHFWREVKAHSAAAAPDSTR